MQAHAQLNPEVNAFQRPFTPRLRNLAESARRLRLFQSQITKLSPPLGIPPLNAIPPFTTVGPRAQNAYDELEDKLKEHERRLSEMNKSWEELGKRKGELEEKRWVLRETAGFFNEVSSTLMNATMCLGKGGPNRKLTSGRAPTHRDPDLVR